MINRRFLRPNAANSMQNKKFQRQNAANSMQHGRFSSKMLQITRKMKGSSSKMLQIACSMERKWQDRCRGRKTEQIRKKKQGQGNKIPRRDSAPINDPNWPMTQFSNGSMLKFFHPKNWCEKFHLCCNFVPINRIKTNLFPRILSIPQMRSFWSNKVSKLILCWFLSERNWRLSR